MTNAVSKNLIIRSLPDDLLLRALSFLEPAQVARAERTCSAWKRAIGSEDQSLWKELCVQQKISVIEKDDLIETLRESVLGTHPSASGSFTHGILGCIAAYAINCAYAINYKEETTFLRANLGYYPLTRYLYNQTGNSSTARGCHWLSDQAEPFVQVWMWMKGKKPLPPSLSTFPTNVPLRLFMDKQGNFKSAGQEVGVIFKGKRIRFTLRYQEEFCDERRITSLKQGGKTRVQLSLNLRMITEAALQHTKDLAKSAPDWIDADFRDTPKS